MVTSLVNKSVPQRPASPTSSLELIASTSGASKAKKKEKASSSSFWDDAGAAVLKAHKTISVDDLSPLGVRPSHELMSSHVHKIMQVQMCEWKSSLFFFLFSFCVLFSHASFFLRKC